MDNFKVGDNVFIPDFEDYGKVIDVEGDLIYVTAETLSGSYTMPFFACDLELDKKMIDSYDK